jgi:hypothetical protein
MNTSVRIFKLQSAWLTLLAGAMLFISHSALAATFSVNNTLDSGPGSLRQAITNANSVFGDDTIVFNIASTTQRTISLLSALPNLDSNITILNDRFGDQNVTIERSTALTVEQFGIFYVAPGHTVTISGLTLTKGVRGAVTNMGSTLTIRKCTLQQNRASLTGGAIENRSASGSAAILTLSSCVLSGNTLESPGGFPYVPNSGGALRNYAQGAGNSASATLIDCVIRQNSVVNTGGFNSHGGAIGNVGEDGGAATLRIDNCTLDGNSTPGMAGAIYNVSWWFSNENALSSAQVTLKNCTLADNVSSSGGGAIHNIGFSGTYTVSLENCTLARNSAGYGGAIDNRGLLFLTNCTLSQNEATSAGSGALNNYGGRASLTNCTFANNLVSVDNQGASISNTNGGSVTTGNSLFVRGGLKPNFFNDATFRSNGNNLSNDAAGGFPGTGPGGLLNAHGDIRNTNPLLQALADNGGPTQTCALQWNSMAVNFGNDTMAPARDQRGVPRNGVSDIGAYEYSGPGF